MWIIWIIASKTQLHVWGRKFGTPQVALLHSHLECCSSLIIGLPNFMLFPTCSLFWIQQPVKLKLLVTLLKCTITGRIKYKGLISANKVQFSFCSSHTGLIVSPQTCHRDSHHRALHLLSLLPEMLFPKNFKWPLISLHPVPKCYLLRDLACPPITESLSPHLSILSRQLTHFISHLLFIAWEHVLVSFVCCLFVSCLPNRK